jgi:type IV pilus assembly protein PilA
MPRAEKGKRRGFSLIEILIVIAIIAVISAVAIPNLLQNRLLANETAAASALMRYATAQDIYAKGNAAAVTGNGAATDATNGDLPYSHSYCSNFRLLYYGWVYGTANPDGSVDRGNAQLELLDKGMADAQAAENTAFGSAAAASLGNAPATATALNGYLFREPADFPPGGENERWASEFALIAYPSLSGSSGSAAFWIGGTRSVFERSLDSGLSGSVAANTGLTTPSSRTGGVIPNNWEPYRR